MPKKAGLAAALSIADDGSASVSVNITDEDGLPITTLTTWPTAVASPSVASSDSNPGPSAFSISPVNPPTSNGNGGFLVATISVVQPVVQPPASNVDFQVTISSGLTGQTAPISEDAGTLSIVADASKPSGFAPVLSEP